VSRCSAVPGAGGQEARLGCEFGSFFSCEDGATPAELLQRGIYSEIAVALKGGPWREASMAMLAVALGLSKEQAEARAAGEDVLSQMLGSADGFLQLGVSTVRVGLDSVVSMSSSMSTNSMDTIGSELARSRTRIMSIFRGSIQRASHAKGAAVVAPSAVVLDTLETEGDNAVKS
jgi:hypothetical protein